MASNNTESRRNTEGLRRHAADKMMANIEKVDGAIDEMKASGEKITVTSVAKRAGVSRSTIYSNPLHVERIKSLQALSVAPSPERMPKSERQRKDEKISALRKRVTELEADKEKLLAQLVEMELLRQENEMLKGRLARVQPR